MPLDVPRPAPRSSATPTAATPSDPEFDAGEPDDLLPNVPGEQLTAQIAAAHARGEKPTLWRRFVLGKDAYSSWELGAMGERLVADQLAALVRKDPSWGFLHSVPIGENGADIDHLVIGPAGVFTVNAKLHRDARVWVGGNTVMVNGVRQPYVRNSRFEANRAAKLLSAAVGEDVPTRGVVVVVNAGDFTVRPSPTMSMWSPGCA